MPRQVEFDREQVLDSAMMVFWRQGYHGTGIQDLVSATGIQRASIYNTFGNKQQFFIDALQRYADICLNNLTAAAIASPSSVGSIKSILDTYKNSIIEKSQGCLLFNTALEMSVYDEKIKKVVYEGTERIEALIHSLVEQAKRDGEISSQHNSDTLVRLVTSAMQSLTIMGSIGTDRKVMDDICSSALVLFYTRPGSNGNPAP